MNIMYSTDYRVKSRTAGYPILGFYYCTWTYFDSDRRGSFDNYRNIFDEVSIEDRDAIIRMMLDTEHYSSSMRLSTIKFTNVLKKDNRLKISLRPYDVEDDVFDLLFLYYVDLLKSDGKSVSESDKLDFNNLAAIIDPFEGEKMVRPVINILDLGEYNCEIFTTVGNEENYDQVDHYQSNIIERSMVSDLELRDRQSLDTNRFIESGSGKRVARMSLSTSNPKYLSGRMTITEDKVIRL